MGANLTEKSLQRAARSVTTLNAICKQFDKVTNVPVPTSAHSTRTDKSDVQKVLKAVQDNSLLMISPGRKHKGFSAMKLNPLSKWNEDDTIAWIEKKKKSFIKNRGMTEQDEDEEDEECEDDEEEDELHEDEEEDSVNYPF